MQGSVSPATSLDRDGGRPRGFCGSLATGEGVWEDGNRLLLLVLELKT